MLIHGLAEVVSSAEALLLGLGFCLGVKGFRDLEFGVYGFRVEGFWALV